VTLGRVFLQEPRLSGGGCVTELAERTRSSLNARDTFVAQRFAIQRDPAIGAIVC